MNSQSTSKRSILVWAACALGLSVAVVASIVLLGTADRAARGVESVATVPGASETSATDAVVSAPPQRPQAELARLGRNADDLSLTDMSGGEVRWGDLVGEPRAVFFGFTHCPEICPTTNNDLAAAVERLGPEARALKIDFVTVDPERDTPALMREYLDSWGPSFRGFGGDETVIRRLAAAFRAAYRRVPLEGGGYTMDHTTSVYLIDARGEVRDVVAYQTQPAVLDAQLRRFLGTP